MQIIVRGKNVAVTPTLHDYAAKKTSRVGKYFQNIQECLVELEVLHQRNISKNQVAHITLWAKGTILRAGEAASDLYSAIDLAFDKLERQIKKYKEKIIDKTHRKKNGQPVIKVISEKSERRVIPEIAEIKKISPKPMSLEEALLEAKMLNARCFGFKNSETNRFNVIYWLKDNKFGLIESTL